MILCLIGRRARCHFLESDNKWQKSLLPRLSVTCCHLYLSLFVTFGCHFLSLFVTFGCHFLSLFITFSNHFLSLLSLLLTLFVTFCHFWQHLFVTFCHFLSLSATFCHFWLSLFVTFSHFLSLFAVTFCHFLSLLVTFFGTFCHFWLSLFVTFCHFQSLFVTFSHYSRVFHSGNSHHAAADLLSWITINKFEDLPPLPMTITCGVLKLCCCSSCVVAWRAVLVWSVQVLAWPGRAVLAAPRLRHVSPAG